MGPDIIGIDNDPILRRRPIWITIIATGQGVNGFVVTLVALGGLYRWLTGRSPFIATSLSVEFFIGIFLIVLLVVGLIAIALAIGMIELRRWAWIGELVLAGLSTLLQLIVVPILVLRGQPVGVITLLCTLGVVLYLLRPRIRTSFCR
jgi:hypothetical protein